MYTRWIVALLVGLGAAPVATAQAPWQFRWHKGQVLIYQVKQLTTVTEVVEGGKQQFRARLDLRKRYRVTEVDAQGVATIEYSLAAMRNEQVRPGGETFLFDSADPSGSTPGLREQLAKYVGTTLAVLRVDAAGKVVAVKQGDAARYGTEPPFTLVLPGTAGPPGQAWVRNFELTLDPPLGTGEKYPAQQRLECSRVADGKATIAVATSLQRMPEAVQERIPLVQKETRGDVVFDVAAGRVTSVRLTIDRTLENHQGAGSSYRFESSYTEQHVAD